MKHAVPKAEDGRVRADAKRQRQDRDRRKTGPRRHRAKRVPEVLSDDVPVLPRGDRENVADGPHPQSRFVPTGALSPRFLQLLAEHQGHLVPVLLAERRGEAVEQGAVDRFGALHTSRTRPVARAC